MTGRDRLSSPGRHKHRTDRLSTAQPPSSSSSCGEKPLRVLPSRKWTDAMFSNTANACHGDAHGDGPCSGPLVGWHKGPFPSIPSGGQGHRPSAEAGGRPRPLSWNFVEGGGGDVNNWGDGNARRGSGILCLGCHGATVIELLVTPQNDVVVV